MNPVNRKEFFDGWRESFGDLTQEQVDGIESLLACLEADEKVADVRWAAYMLATTYHETAKTMQPIEEYGHGKGKKYGTKDEATGQTYYGRGYVQLTWKSNYAAMGTVFDIDLVHNPSLALQPDIAYKIMSHGMRNGYFTGVGLRRYITDEKCDYLNARRIINGMDAAQRIAGYAEKIESTLRGAA